MNFFPFNVGDYAAHTGHLEPMEDLAYRRLLDVYYMREEALPADIQATAKLVRMRSMAADVECVLREFFKLTDAGWTHKRCDAEILKMKEKQAKARASAALSVNVRRASAERSAITQQATVERTLPIDAANVERTLPKKEANAELPIPIPIPVKDNTVGGPALRADPTTPPVDLDPPPNPPIPPPIPPPPFDGTNAEALNGKAVVALASGWDLPDQWGFDAEALGWKPGEVLRESEKFRQYWFSGRGAGTRRSVNGWRQTWSTWLEKASRDKR